MRRHLQSHAGWRFLHFNPSYFVGFFEGLLYKMQKKNIQKRKNAEKKTQKKIMQKSKNAEKQNAEKRKRRKKNAEK